MHSFIRGIFLITGVAFIYGCAIERSSSENYALLHHRLDSVVQGFVDSAKIAGASVAIAKGDSIILEKNYGYADLEWKTPIPADAIFEIGSMTKQFTAVAILRLAEQNKLALDDDIHKYVKFDTRGRTVTIRHLLSHSSGIREYATFPNFFSSLSRQHLTGDSILRMVEKTDFDFEPRDNVLYSNSGYYLLGRIIEKASGVSYGEYLQENIFDKVGMNNSCLCDERKIVDRRVHGYAYDQKLVHSTYLVHNWTYAGGIICSCTKDLIKWNYALHHGKLLSPAMYQELITPIQLNDSITTRYAKGLNVWRSSDRYVIFHGGKTFGFLTEGRYFPDEDLTLVTLVNTHGPVTPEQINDVAVEALTGSKKKEKKFYAGDLSALAGTYEGAGKGVRTVVTVLQKDSTLTLQFGTGRVRVLKFEEGNTWREGIDLYSFRMNDGKVTDLNADRGYDFYRLKKVK